MPRRISSVCSQPGCPNPAPCAEHTRPPWRDAHERRPASTQVPRYQRARILRRDPVCRLCHLAPSVEVDHIHGASQHAKDDELQGVCQPCHQVKTQAEAARARWG